MTCTESLFAVLTPRESCARLFIYIIIILKIIIKGFATCYPESDALLSFRGTSARNAPSSGTEPKIKFYSEIVAPSGTAEAKAQIQTTLRETVDKVRHFPAQFPPF